MLTTYRWLWVVVGVALAAVAVHAQESELARGAELLTPFKRNLQEALRRGLAEGPVEAIAACHLQAPEIAKNLSREGIHLGRTSHLLRNPSNVPPEWVRPILEAYVASPSDRTPRIVSLSNSQSGYVEPILLRPICVICHGHVLAPDVASRIKELYPEDRAVGFQVGELRGAFWIEFPAAE